MNSNPDKIMTIQFRMSHLFSTITLTAVSIVAGQSCNTLMWRGPGHSICDVAARDYKWQSYDAAI